MKGPSREASGSDGRGIPVLVRACLLHAGALAPLAAPEASARLAAVVAAEADLGAEAAALARDLGAALPGLRSAEERGALLRVRRAVHRDRAPLDGLDAALADLPPSLPADLRARLEAHGRARRDLARAGLEAADDAGRAAERASGALLALAASPAFRAALWLASPALDAGLARALEEGGATGGAPSAPAPLPEKLEAALGRYLSRATLTTTPSGLFAGVALGRLAAGRTPRPIALADPPLARLAVEPDLDAFRAALVAFSRRPGVARRLTLRPDPTLHEADGALRFKVADAGRELPASPLNQLAVAVLRERARSLEEAARELRRRHDPEVPLGEYRERLEALLDLGALAATPTIGPDGAAPLAAVSRLAAALPARAAAPLRRALEAARRLRAAVAAAARGVAAGAAVGGSVGVGGGGATGSGAGGLARARKAAAECRRRLLALAGDDGAVPAGSLVRADAVLGLAPGYDRLPAAVLPALGEAIAVHAALARAIEPPRAEPPLVARFRERFGRGPAPLAALEPLLLDLHGAERADWDDLRGAERRRFFRPRGPAGLAAYGRLRDVVLGRAAGPGQAVEIDAADLASVIGDDAAGAASPGPYPADCLFQVAARDVESLAGGRMLVVLGAVHPRAGALTARFAGLFPALADPPRAALAREAAARRDGRFAEVLFQPPGVPLGAGRRPRYVADAVEVEGPPSARARARVLGIEDLAVGLEAGPGGALRLVTRDRRGLKVVPVHHSAVSTFPSLAWLLAQIGLHGRAPVPVRSRLLEERPAAGGGGGGGGGPAVAHVPRVVCGRAVITRERWVLAPGELPRPARGGGREVARALLDLERLRARRGLPRLVFVRTDAEARPLAVDLEAPPLAALLLRLAAKARVEVVVEEALPGPLDLWLERRPGGARHACELLATVLEAPRVP